MTIPNPPPTLDRDQRLAVMDRAEVLALKAQAVTDPAAVVNQLMADYAGQGVHLPRACVEQAVRELAAAPANDPTPAPPVGVASRLYRALAWIPWP